MPLRAASATASSIRSVTSMLSGGRTREVNRTLAIANARLAGEVSIALAAL
jgi:hypothetical protein